MIVAEPKPIEEVIESIKDYKNVMVVGCQTCVAVSMTGGDKQARELAESLTYVFKDSDTQHSFKSASIERQCEKDWILPFFESVEGIDAILSLGCGAGVQTMAAVFTDIPVLPGLNTTFLGASDQPGVLKEMCVGCGDCILGLTGGICPVTRCAKGLLNGPCGGSSKGLCEISIPLGREVECAWHLIIERLTERGQLENYAKIAKRKNWAMSNSGGPRQFVHPGESPF